VDSMNQEELKELVAYEVFFLIEAYEIIQHPLSGRYEETLEFPHDGSDSRRTAHAYVSMMTGDWRSGFLRAGGPLILASSFKIFDLILEQVRVGHCSSNKRSRCSINLPESGLCFYRRSHPSGSALSRCTKHCFHTGTQSFMPPDLRELTEGSKSHQVKEKGRSEIH